METGTNVRFCAILMMLEVEGRPGWRGGREEEEDGGRGREGRGGGNER